jgi:tight adherence protein B
MASLMAPLLMFLLGAGLVGGVYWLVTWLPAARTRERIDRRIAEVAHPLAEQSGGGDALLVKGQVKGVLPTVDRAMAQTPAGVSLAALIEQAGVKMGVSTLLLLAAFSTIVGAFLLATVFRASWGLLPGAIAGLALPYVVLRKKRTYRMRRFEEQFPEALDLLSRAIRAGHAFTTAMGMVADDAPDPIGPEFRKTFDEQNFGLPLKDALLNMCERVPLMDVRFFVTAVLIQRETGGNLSEILDNLSHVVRERFKILRQVRVYTAHGRLTGWVLMALPASLAVALSFINPDHIDLLFKEQMGRMMILAAIVMQTVGYVWIQKVIKIEV